MIVSGMIAAYPAQECFTLLPDQPAQSVFLQERAALTFLQRKMRPVLICSYVFAQAVSQFSLKRKESAQRARIDIDLPAYAARMPAFICYAVKGREIIRINSNQEKPP